MAYLNRYRLGERVPIFLLTYNNVGTGIEADSAPYARVWLMNAASAPTAVEVVKLHAHAPAIARGRYIHDLLLDSSYAAGHYWVTTQATASGLNQDKRDVFQVVGGGNDAGVPHSLKSWVRPESEVLISALEDGSVVAGRNPVFKEVT